MKVHIKILKFCMFESYNQPPTKRATGDLRLIPVMILFHLGQDYFVFSLPLKPMWDFLCICAFTGVKSDEEFEDLSFPPNISENKKMLFIQNASCKEIHSELYKIQCLYYYSMGGQF